MGVWDVAPDSREAFGNDTRILDVVILPRGRQEPGQERTGALQSGEKSFGLSGAVLVGGAGLGFRVRVVLVEGAEAHGAAERGFREYAAGARCVGFSDGDVLFPSVSSRR